MHMIRRHRQMLYYSLKSLASMTDSTRRTTTPTSRPRPRAHHPLTMPRLKWRSILSRLRGLRTRQKHEAPPSPVVAHQIASRSPNQEYEISAIEVKDAIPSPPRLLTLPSGLRNLINTHALPTSTQEFRFNFGIYQPVPVLLRICQQIRCEAIGLYYNSLPFEFLFHHNCLRQFAGFLRSLSSQARNALAANAEVNVRIFVDTYHPRFAEIENSLGCLAHCQAETGWSVSMEHFEDKRKGVGFLVDMRWARVLARHRIHGGLVVPGWGEQGGGSDGG